MKAKLLALAMASTLIVFSIAALAEIAEESWTRVVDETLNDVAYAIALDAVGNVNVTGSSVDSTDYESITVKYSPDGTKLWTKPYNSSIGKAIATDAVGNVYIAGHATNGTNNDFFTAKYNTLDGSEEWVKLYNGTGDGYDYATAIAVDALGNAYVTGYSHNGISKDYTTVKYNAVDGTQEWVQIYDGTGSLNDYTSSIALDADGNAYVTGHAIDRDRTNDFVTIKYNSVDGTQEWINICELSSYSNLFATDIAVDADGNAYVTGYSHGSSDNDCVMVKYDTDGVEQWRKIHDETGDSNSAGSVIKLGNNGHVYVAGNVDSDYFTLKYDAADGSEIWTKTHNGTGDANDIIQDMALDVEDNVYVTGLSKNADDNFDYVTIKYAAANGNEEWMKTFNGTAGTANNYDKAYGIAVNASGDVYVTGCSKSSTYNYDYLTIKYVSGDCVIDDQGYSNGDENPGDICDICDANQSTNSWSWNDECAEFSVPIALGYNILGRAIDQPKLLWASDIALDIDAQGGSVLEISVWSSSTASWRTYDPTFPIDDFIITPTDGFIVRAAGPSVWEIEGLVQMDGPQLLDSVNGYTLVAVPSDDYAMISDLVADMNGAGCLAGEVSRWDTSTGAWETYDPTFPLYDYPLDRITGYFVRSAGNCQFDLNP